MAAIQPLAAMSFFAPRMGHFHARPLGGLAGEAGRDEDVLDDGHVLHVGGAAVTRERLTTQRSFGPGMSMRA